jgi:aminoglycoside phosphotransferase (APT) family kinase protein
MAEDLSTSPARELARGGGPGLPEASPEALAHVPGFAAGNAEVTPLPGGGFNRSSSVRTPAGRFVLRWSPAPDAWLVADRSVERSLHGLAASAGLAPRIVYADPDDRWLVTEFVEGVVWTDDHFARDECMAALGDTLRELHAIPPPAVGRFDLLQALGAYAARLDGAPVPGNVPAGEYLEQAAVAWQLSAAPERPVAVLHHDLHGSNVIETHPRRLVLIDWECAVVNDPLLDVACVLSYFASARAHANVLLSRAGLGHVTVRQLAASVWLFDLHTWFWYRERRMRTVPTPAEVAAEGRLAAAVGRGIPSAL